MALFQTSLRQLPLSEFHPCETYFKFLWNNWPPPDVHLYAYPITSQELIMKNPSSFSKAIKLASVVAVLGGAFIAAPSFAANFDASSSSVAQTAAAPQPTANAQVYGKTRAEVYQELVTAEKSGQLAHLNATIYADS
jgi:hypothetical protein